MMSKAPFLRPPRIAVWLVGLFIPNEQEHSVSGDLAEEFSDLASKSGVALARRWYWRQSLRTIAHLIGYGFRVAPWQIAGAVVGGFLLYWLGAVRMQHAIVAIFDFRRQPHVHPYYTWPQAQARLFWVKYGVLAGHLVLSMFIGCIVAMVAKAREMVATITLSLVLGLSGIVEFLAWSAKHGYAFLPLPLVITFGVSIMIIMGGGIIRKSRLATARSTTPD